MPISFLPSLMLDALPSLTEPMLRERGIRLVMLDFDNTIVPYTTDVPSEPVLEWIKRMQQTEIGLCVVSNSKKARVPAFCTEYGLPYVTHAHKPFPDGIRRCLARFSVLPEQCALVGDQIFTDTLGANCAGLCSVLVTPIRNHNLWLKLRHVAEQPFIFAARRRRRVLYDKP